MASMEREARTPRKPHSLFYPSGPITAKHTKNREWLHSARGDGDRLVWPKSGPPTHEARKNVLGEEVPPLLDSKKPAVLAGRAVVELRRDLNGLIREGRKDPLLITKLLQPTIGYSDKEQKKREEKFEDVSDDELWEHVGRHSLCDEAVVKKKVIAQLVSERSLDAPSRRGSASTSID
eukprot:TRINITY_DN65267_c0_g1_i1.p1 TRINITY_DN65267_c0_g1~~TRINITY_DN65267_c0_g1_i1.p1  ORF type:complete len:178 (+),score=23.26 TRINITY_DN65267_c0_g1_i1:39-572(+)